MRVPYIAGIDNSVSCFDCDKRESSESFEPCFRLDTVTGETLHVMICAECIEDIETVHNADVVRVIGKYAAKVRHARDNRIRADRLRLNPRDTPFTVNNQLGVLCENCI